jgi:hypothetical protein
MTKAKKTAPAEQETIAEPTITAPRTTRIREGGKQHTALIYTGDKPEIGAVLRFTLANGVTYEGTVKDFTEAGGEVLAEFSDGPRPVAPK